MSPRLLLLCLVAAMVSPATGAQPADVAALVPTAAPLDPTKHWEADFETGVLWHVTGSATPLDYVLLLQIFTVKTPVIFGFPLGGGDLVLRSRYSLLAEPIVQGPPEHRYLGVAGSGMLEWWDRARTRCLFFSGGGGFGWMDSRGYQIAGAQGQDFNLNWFAYTGARFRCAEKLSVSAGLYFQHISNGHLNKVDPGINALGPVASLGWHF